MWISHLHLLMDHSFSNGLLTSGPDLDALFALKREREREREDIQPVFGRQDTSGGSYVGIWMLLVSHMLV